jgi:hypothetical protein
MIGMIYAIEELRGLTTRERVGMLKESASFVLQFKAQDGVPEQVPIGAMLTSGGTNTPM